MVSKDMIVKGVAWWNKLEARQQRKTEIGPLTKIVVDHSTTSLCENGNLGVDTMLEKHQLVFPRGERSVCMDA